MSLGSPLSGTLSRRGRTGRLLAIPGLTFLAAFGVGARRPPAPDLALAPGTPVRVGLIVGADEVTVGSGSGMRIVDAQTGVGLGALEGGRELRAGRNGGSLRLQAGDAEIPGIAYTVRIEPDGAGPLTVDGKSYRGLVDLVAVEDSGVTAVNELPLEDYLLGVVPLEMGPRDETEFEAVAAQAVAARTYAVSHLGAHREMGFDLYGSVEDQVYGGLDAERPESTRAVRETAGRILVYDGLPIRAFYHSTCGGRTAAVEEVLDRPPAPYLRSVSDRAPDGTDWCAISPRYRWTARFDAARIDGAVRDEVARMFGVRPETLGEIDEIRVLDRTPSGRVRDLAIRGPHTEVVVSRLDIRFALRQPENGGILGSTDFELERSGSAVELRGRGYGHGAGMCQWGAIARARAGQSHEEILSAYYPGAELVEVY